MEDKEKKKASNPLKDELEGYGEEIKNRVEVLEEVVGKITTVVDGIMQHAIFGTMSRMSKIKRK